MHIETLIAAGDAAPAARDMPAEVVLDQCAGALAIDRDDETTLDSDGFPKVVHLDQVAADTRDADGANTSCEPGAAAVLWGRVGRWVARVP